MRKLLLILTGIVLVATACASSPTAGVGSQAAPTATPVVQPTQQPTTGPTPVVIPTTAPTTAPTTQPTSTAVPSVQPTSTAPQPTATAAPIPTAVPTTAPQPTATPQPTPTSQPPAPTATAVPATPTPTPTAGWVNPDCYVGPGAADEPVWWCGGRICVVGAPHYGCPTTPPTFPVVRVDCKVSDRTIVVNEVITLTAVQYPSGIPMQFAFNHGDGTIDRTGVSRAYYRAPGTYTVTLLWQYNGGKGSTACGTVTVRSNGSPTPTPTPNAVQIGCSISPQRTVQVNETLTFTAFQNPTSVPVSYVFDHGDGTLDETSQSFAYYAQPGFYEVRLRWAYGNQSGTTFCGTVTVEPNFNAADYIGLTLGAAEALAASDGLTTRIVRIDDQVFPGTSDYRLDRVNFEIDQQIVSSATLG